MGTARDVRGGGDDGEIRDDPPPPGCRASGRSSVLACLAPLRRTRERLKQINKARKQLQHEAGEGTLHKMGHLVNRLSVRSEDQFCRHCGARKNDSEEICQACGSGSADDLSEMQSHRLSVRRQNQARKTTLNKYIEVMNRTTRKGVNTMDAGFRARLDDSRKVFHAIAANERLKQANNIRERFFGTEGTKQDGINSLSLNNDRVDRPKVNVFEELHRDDSSNSGSGGDSSDIEPSFSLDLVDVPESEEVRYNEDVDKYLAKSLVHLETDHKAVAKMQKLAHQEKLAYVKQLRHRLLSEQDHLIATLRSKSKVVIAGLRKQIKNLTSLLQQQTRESLNLDKESLEHIAEITALSKAFSSTTTNHGTDSDLFHEEYQKQLDRKGSHSSLLQEAYEKRTETMQEQLAIAVQHLDKLELEVYFPKVMQWKLRLSGGDGLFIGMRDVDLEMLDGDFVIGRGDEPGTIQMQVTKIRAIVGIYQLSINGSTATSKLLRGLLTPTVNRLDLEISGNWNLMLRYKPGDDETDKRPKWVKEKSVFDLHLSKQTSGAGLLTLPKRVIEWITTSLLPTVISSSIMLSIPTRLGVFFQHPQNYVHLGGKFKVKGDIPPRVWVAPLVGPTASAKLARRAMGLSDEEAVLLDLMFRSDLATQAGFHRKAISMARLYKWRLQYASMPLSRLAKFMELIETNPHVLLQAARDGPGATTDKAPAPSQWAYQILKRVCELAAKPGTLDILVTEVELDININQGLDVFTGSYLDALQHEADFASGSRALRVAKRKLKQGKEYVTQVEKGFETYGAMLSKRIDFDFSFLGMGGLISGIMIASIHDLEAQLKLPETFSWSWLMGQAEELSEGMDFTLSGSAGPGNGEYTLKAKHKWVNPADAAFPHDATVDDDARAVIRDVQLNLFPRDGVPGSINLYANSLRASLFMAALAEMTMLDPDEEVSPPNDLLHRVASHNRTTSEFLEEPQVGSSVDELLDHSRAILADLWGRYATSRDATKPRNVFSHHNSISDPVKQAEVKARLQGVLPAIMTDERYDLQLDLRGLKIAAIREIGKDLKGAVRVTLAKSKHSGVAEGECTASLHIRFSIAEFFEDVDSEVFPAVHEEK
mmetsp:Transcript_7755/g.13626  ORF Transcript_7755/g.13626 Transcript_7755/m.13626 type:complete len:1106 (-) Transcript_7755:216-3533(-)